MERAARKRAQEREKRVQAAFDASGGLYTATLHAPPHPHTVVGLAVGDERPSAMEAVVSMQADAVGLGADGVLGVAICVASTATSDFWYVAYGTAVKWAQTE